MKREYVTGIEKIGGKFVIFTEDSIYKEPKSLEDKVYSKIESGYLRYLDSDEGDVQKETAYRFAQIAKEHYLGVLRKVNDPYCSNCQCSVTIDYIRKALEES